MHLVAGTIFGLAIGAPMEANASRGWARRPREDDNPQRWLNDTPALQIEHPSLRLHTKKLTQLKLHAQDKAVACFQYLRTMPFKTVSDPTRFTAPQVLRCGYGDCHTKSMLFVAMMRALRIPARTRIVTLRPDFLFGLLDTGGKAVSHAISEIHLHNRWIGVDAYCIDLKLGLAARTRLLREGIRLGYGVHVAGQIAWDGASDAYGQFSAKDPLSLPLGEIGVYDDLASLAQHSLLPQMHWAGQARWQISTALLNRRIKALRRSIGVSATRAAGASL